VLGTAVVWVAALAAILAPYLRVRLDLGARSWQTVALFLPTWRSWLTVPDGAIAGRLLPSPRPEEFGSWEKALFPGFVVLFGVVLACVITIRRGHEESRRGPLVLSSLVAAAILVGLSLAIPYRIREFLPADAPWSTSLWWFVYRVVPGAAAIRAVSRVWVIVNLLLIVVASLGIDSGVRKAARRAPLITASGLGLLFLLGIVESVAKGLPSFPKRLLYAEVDSVRAAIPPGCSSFYLPVRTDRPFFISQLVAMHASVQANVPTVNGYSGNSPAGYADPTRTMTAEEIRNWTGRTGSPEPCLLGSTP
jgi:hypothetical protein